MPRPRSPKVIAPATPSSLREELAPALRALRTSWSKLLTALPDPIHRAVDLRRALNLSAELSWQIFRIATATDAAAIAQFIPRPGSVRRVIDAATARGVSPTILQAITDAHANYEHVMAQHAGDRAAFSAIAGSVGATADAPIDIKDRRAAFRANRNIWGVQAAARIATSIVVPDQPDGSTEAVALGALTGFYAVRPAITVDMQLAIFATDARGRAIADPNATNNMDPWERVGLLREFSSPQLPPLRTQPHPDGVPRGSLTLPGIGRSSAIDLYYARALHGQSSPRISGGGIVHRPCEVAIVDLMVARTRTRWSEPTAAVYARIDDVDQVSERRPQDRHPWDVPVTRAQVLREAPPIPEAPQYAPAVASILQRHGWADLHFDLYRVRMDYPVLHTAIDISIQQFSE